MGDNASSVDIESIRETYNHILEAEKVVGEWIFHIDRCPITLKIKVVKFIAGPNRGKYMGIAKLPDTIPTPGRALHKLNP